MTLTRLVMLLAWSLMPLASQTGTPQKTRELDLQLSSQGGFRIVGKKTIYEGNVTVKLPGLLLMTADQTVYDSEAGIIVASGNVKIDYYSKLGLIEVTAQEATYHDDGTAGSFKEVTVPIWRGVLFRWRKPGNAGLGPGISHSRWVGHILQSGQSPMVSAN